MMMCLGLSLMNDKEYREQKKRIEKLIKKWVDVLGLGWWCLRYNYIRGSHDGGPTAYAPPTDKSGDLVCVMTCTTDYYYKTAELSFYLETLMGYSDRDVERYFIHELMHIHLKPMQTRSKAAEEELVATQLADAFLWVDEKAEKSAKK